MTRQTGFLIGSLFLLMTAEAQDPVKKLAEWSEGRTIEKIYIHFDRDNYMAGQTAWFKAYLYSDFLPHDKSTSLFVELVDKESKIISRHTFPVVVGVSRGQIELPETLTTGNYIIQAYTATMLNQGDELVYKKQIPVTGKKVAGEAGAADIYMDFFPEGGNFIAGQSNTIAFKITNSNGLPLNAAGTIYNTRTEIVGKFSTYHDGMGMFDLVPAANDSFYATIGDTDPGKKYPLPLPINKGIVFRLMPGEAAIHFEIGQSGVDQDFQAAYMVGQMQHNVLFRQELGNAALLSGLIRISNMPSGILHITVFNKYGMPLAERLSFVNNKEYVLKAELILDTIDHNHRGRNRFSVHFPDTVAGNFSVSVTDHDFDVSGYRSENIYTSLLLTGDLKGYVHDPAYYFLEKNDSARYALDLLMMTHGWRRFKWTEILKQKLPPPKYKDPGYINISGKVTLENVKKPFANKDLMLMVIAADSSRSVQILKTDNDGRYQVDSLVFFNKAQVYFSDIRGKQNLFIDVFPDADSLHRPYQLSAPGRSEFPRNFMLSGNRKWAEGYEAMLKANGEILSEIIVRSKKSNPIAELDEKYASGAFSGDSRKIFDLENTDDGNSYRTIMDFLDAKGFAPGWRNMPTISAMGNYTTDIFLDEIPLLELSVLELMPLNKVAMIKIYTSFVGSWGNGPGGAISIYSKKGEDLWKSMPTTGETLSYNGFSVIKEFYSPDYAMPPLTNDKPDHRMTIYWKPDVYVDGVNKTLGHIFYNNDRTRRFKIVIEGMTADGKLLLIERCY